MLFACSWESFYKESFSSTSPRCGFWSAVHTKGGGGQGLEGVGAGGCVPWARSAVGDARGGSVPVPVRGASWLRCSRPWAVETCLVVGGRRVFMFPGDAESAAQFDCSLPKAG